MKHNQVVSGDKKYKAWVEIKGFLNNSFRIVVRRTGLRGLLSGKRTLELGSEYYEPNITAIEPDMPISLGINVGRPKFSQNKVLVDVTYTLNYANKPKSIQSSVEELLLN